jgi:competence protein ComEC
VRPGGYDWGRDAFFLGLGAVGLADGPPRVIEGQPEPSVRQKLSEAIGKTRNAIAKRIGGILSGPVGAIAASLVVGERGAIPERINEAMRVSGLAHVLSISGLHMAMFAGLIYQGVRILLALSGSLALRYPIRKWAAVMAAFAAFGYLLLSGAEIAAQRSFLMAALAFLAIVLDRSVLTVRSVALAAGLLLVAFPEAVLSISFQMSFAAVLALIAAYEAWRDRRVEREGERRGWFWRLTIGAIMASLVTTLVAGLATAPFGAFYFQRTGVYSLLANLAAMPLIGAIIMPGAVVGLLLYPFGLDGWAWSVMGFGISGMVWVAEQVAALPGAAWHSAAFGTGAFLLMGLALVWACLWRTSLRLLAILPLVIGIAFAATNQRPDIYIEPEGRAMAVRHPDGQLRITGLRFARFAAGNWLAADGDSRDLQDRGITSDVYCDRAACRLTLPDGRAAVLAWTYQALREDCGRAALVVTRLVAPPGCRAVTYVVDAEDLAARGAVTLKLDGGDFRIASVREPSAARAWYNRPVVRRPDFPKIPSTSSEPSEDTSEDPAASDATGPDGALQ